MPTKQQTKSSKIYVQLKLTRDEYNKLRGMAAMRDSSLADIFTNYARYLLRKLDSTKELPEVPDIFTAET